MVVVSVVCQADLLCDRKRRWGRETGEEREKRRVIQVETRRRERRRRSGRVRDIEALTNPSNPGTEALPRMMSEHRRKVWRVAMPEGRDPELCSKESSCFDGLIRQTEQKRPKGTSISFLAYREQGTKEETRANSPTQPLSPRPSSNRSKPPSSSHLHPPPLSPNLLQSCSEY